MLASCSSDKECNFVISQRFLRGCGGSRGQGRYEFQLTGGEIWGVFCRQSWFHVFTSLGVRPEGDTRKRQGPDLSTEPKFFEFKKHSARTRNEVFCICGAIFGWRDGRLIRRGVEGGNQTRDRQGARPPLHPNLASISETWRAAAHVPPSHRDLASSVES